MRDTTQTKEEAQALEQTCDNCLDQYWVCENHSAVPWNDGDPICCGGAGKPCPKCNDGRDVRIDDFTVARHL